MISVRLVRWSGLALAGCLLTACQSGVITVAAVGESVVADDGYQLSTWRLIEQGDDGESRTPPALVIYATGSEDETVTKVIGHFAGFTTMGARVVLPERRGVSESDPLDTAATRQGAAREQRIADLTAVVRAASRAVEPGVPLLLVGASEGADIAAAVAAREPRVTQVLLIGGGGGWTQAEELRFMVQQHPGYLGIRDEEELDARLTDIRNRPEADDAWLGHPYRRWSSFLWARAADDLVRRRIPIFVAHGDRDENVPVQSARALRDRLAEAKADFEYHEYAGADHRFMRTDQADSTFPHLEVDVVRWLEHHGVIAHDAADTFVERVHAVHPSAW